MPRQNGRCEAGKGEPTDQEDSGTRAWQQWRDEEVEVEKHKEKDIG